MSSQEQFPTLPSPPHRFVFTETDNSLVVEHCGRLFKWSELRLPLENQEVALPEELRGSRYATKLQAKLVEAGYTVRYAYALEQRFRRGLETIQLKR